MRDPEPPKSKASRVCFSQERFLQLFAVSFMAASGPVINKAAHPLPLHLHGKESLFVIEDSTDLLGGFKAQNPPSMARMIEPPVICIPGGSPTIHGGSTSSDMSILGDAPRKDLDGAASRLQQISFHNVVRGMGNLAVVKHRFF